MVSARREGERDGLYPIIDVRGERGFRGEPPLAGAKNRKKERSEVERPGRADIQPKLEINYPVRGTRS